MKRSNWHIYLFDNYYGICIKAKWKYPDDNIEKLCNVFILCRFHCTSLTGMCIWDWCSKVLQTINFWLVSFGQFNYHIIRELFCQVNVILKAFNGVQKRFSCQCLLDNRMSVWLEIQLHSVLKFSLFFNSKILILVA